MDNKDPGIRKISVEVSEEPPHCLDIDDKCISYDNSGDGCTVQAFGGSNNYIEKVPLNGILDDLAVILKNPKLRLNLLEISAFEEQKAILKVFGDITHSRIMLHIIRIKLEGFEPCDFISMLSYFKPGVLEEIHIENLSNFTDATQVSDLFELEQWKQAKSISIIISKKHFNFPIEHLFHLSRFQVNWVRLSIDDAIKIRDVSLKNLSFGT